MPSVGLSLEVLFDATGDTEPQLVEVKFPSNTMLLPLLRTLSFSRSPGRFFSAPYILQIWPGGLQGQRFACLLVYRSS